MSTQSVTQRQKSATRIRLGDRLTVVCMSVIALLLYLSTAAQGTIFGDPSEYQFIPGIWGIAHPPGYALYTLITGVWQRIIPFGSMAWRAHILACLMGAWIVSRVMSIVLILIRNREEAANTELWPARLVAMLVASLVMLATDVWQHSIHSNAHIMSAAISVTQLWICVQWYISDNNLWLYLLAFSCGIGVTHHPITVWSLPGYAMYILVRRPRIWKDWRTILLFITSGLSGLLPWLYFPLRSPTTPFGPTDMATWEGFLRHATAQGLRVNLFHFGLADQWNRLRVFWSLTQLQYPFAFVILVLPGFVWLSRKHRVISVLIFGFMTGHLLFTLNSVQDVMAYLLHPFIAMAIPLGLGLWWILEQWALAEHGARWILVASTVLMLLIWTPAFSFKMSDISLRDWNEADEYVTFLNKTFGGTEGGAAIVSDWEHLTPYYYYAYVEGQPADPNDYHPEFVSGAMPWVESVFTYLPEGPVYLTNYRPDVRDLGFRLRPIGPLWQVVEPTDRTPVKPQFELSNVWIDQTIQILGYDINTDDPVYPGDTVPLSIYATVPMTTTSLYMPEVTFAGVDQGWMTDSRIFTWDWQPGEIIVEQYEIFVPYDLAPGAYMVNLSYMDVLHQTDAPNQVGCVGNTMIQLGALIVMPASGSIPTHALDTALTNVGNDVALSTAYARSGLQIRRGVWEQPLELADNRVLNLTLNWEVLSKPDKNYTIFVHLLDQNGQPVFIHDYTPLGGAFPSYLWFPKWLPGQQVTDPYRLVLPESVPSGSYLLEVGIYEMGSIRRIPQLDAEGNMTGDRLILGTIAIE